MPICKKCNKSFPNRVKIDSKIHIVSSRSFCLDCSPFKKHNTKNLIKKPKIKKKCPRCKKNLPISFFYGRRNGQGVSSYCKKCTNDQTIERQVEIKLKAISYLGGKCVICGYHKYAGSLTFHHRDPSKKDFTIASKSCLSFEKIKKELNKCILVCRNCHGELHGNIIELPR